VHGRWNNDNNTSACTRNIVTSAGTIQSNTSAWTRNIVTSTGTMENNNSIHEQSECYTCKQYECNEYVRSALARSKVTIEERSDDIIKPKPSPKGQPTAKDNQPTTLELKLSPHKAHTDRSRASRQQKISRCSGYLLLNSDNNS
jgi:hypothetical protein